MWTIRHTLAALAVVLLIPAAVVIAAATDKPPKPTAADVWRHLERANYRESWKFWPGKDALYKGQDPHGMLLTTYVNPPALAALKNKAGKLPAGSIIVKENYMPDKQLGAVTVMYKAPAGYDPEHNDWFWMKRPPDGKVEASGKVADCQNCHRASQRDYLLTPLPE